MYEKLFSPLEILFDIGTENTRIAILGKGTVLRESSYIGQNTKNDEYIFFGTEAKEMLGKTPAFVSIIQPIQNSILSDFDAYVTLLNTFMQKAVLPYYKSSRLIRIGMTAYASVPATSTEVEQKATKEALRKVGFTTVHLVEKPFCFGTAAKGTVHTNTPVFVVDLGAGSVEIAVLIMGGIVTHKSIRYGGHVLDKQIAQYVHLKNGVILGELTVERLKNTLFNLTGHEDVMTVRGKSLESGLPKAVKITSGEIREALSSSVNHIVDGIKEVIEMIPPEIVDGAVQNGLTLTGELANVAGLQDYIGKEIKMPVLRADNPGNATLNGLMRLLKNREALKKILI